MEVMDEESGAFSWEAFTAFGQVAMAQAKRREGSVSLIVVSVDELRDSFSSAGISVEATAVLVVASVLLRQVRSSDMVGRHGPRSFAVLAQDAGQAGVMRLAERIHAALPEKLSGLHGPVPFTVSMGIATMPDAGTNLPAVLRCAEETLLSAAGDGGNRVRISGETRAVVPIGVDRFAEKRQAALSRLIQAFERGDVEGIALRTRPGACTVCLETAREIYKPDWVPVPPLFPAWLHQSRWLPLPLQRPVARSATLAAAAADCPA